MTHIFVDAAAWIALLNTRDALHSQATRLTGEHRRLRTQQITTEFVLLEVADGLADPAFRAKTVAFIGGLRRLPQLQIVPVSQALCDDGWAFYQSRLDKAWSLTDCISFVVMNQLQLTVAFTSDRHFEQAGFQKLL